MDSEFDIVIGEESVGYSSFSSSSRPADSVDVTLNLLGTLEVDNSLDILHIDSSGCNVSGH